MTHRTKVWISISLIIIIFFVCALILPNKDQTFINYLSIIGSLVSLLGIGITYLQILSVREITIKTRQEVTESLRIHNNNLMLSEVSRKAAMIDEIQIFLKNDKIELCVLRMKDLKIILNNLKNQEYYSTFFGKKEFKSAFTDFNNDLYNLQKYDFSSSHKLDKLQIILNLEKLSTVLLNIEIKLKTQNHDS